MANRPVPKHGGVIHGSQQFLPLGLPLRTSSGVGVGKLGKGLKPGHIKIAQLANKGQQCVQRFPRRDRVSCQFGLEQPHRALKTPPAHSGLVQHFRIFRAAQQIKVGGELAKHFTQHELRRYRHAHAACERWWIGAQRLIQAVLQQRIATLGFADVQRQRRQNSGDLPRHLEQSCWMARQQFEFELAHRGSLVAGHDLPDVQRHLNNTAAALAHRPAGSLKGGDQARHQRLKHAAVRVKLRPGCSLQRLPRQTRIWRGHFPFTPVAQCRVTAPAHFQGLQPL